LSATNTAAALCAGTLAPDFNCFGAGAAARVVVSLVVRLTFGFVVVPLVARLVAGWRIRLEVLPMCSPRLFAEGRST
jgi:hypothetical protein